MKDLTKKDFSCWGNGDKYDDELFISHDPKFTAVEIADKILKNQKDVKKIDEMYIKLGQYKQDAELCKHLVKILSNHCGETGKNEGAVDTLKRKLEDAEKWNTSDDMLIRNYQKTLEIVEGLKNLLNGISHDSLVSSSSLRKILEGKK